MSYHVSKARFGELVEQALAELPEPFAKFLDEVPVQVRERPTFRQLRIAGLEDGDGLMGLYDGIALTESSVEHSGVPTGTVFIFQEAIEGACQTEEDLVREVRITVLHEIGHHFGLDEDDLDRLGYG